MPALLTHIAPFELYGMNQACIGQDSQLAAIVLLKISPI